MKKQHGGNEAVYTNSAEAAMRAEAPHYSLYANPYFVMHDGERYTEHIYIGSERIAVRVAKLSDESSVLGNFDEEEMAGQGIVVGGIDYGVKRKAQEQVIEDCYDSLQFAYLLVDRRSLVNIGMVPSGADTSDVDDSDDERGTANPDTEWKRVYYYSTDHLGSSRLVLDSNGLIAERLMFLPTGEVFMDEQNTTDYHSDFLFSGKELDAETGNYYFGARYLAPRLGIWLSPDPMQLKYPHVSSYAYCMGNPVKLIDLFGLAPGDFFRTVNAAAIDFGLFYNDNSIREGREYGSSIYVVYNRKGEKGYSYSIPNKGKIDEVVPSDPPIGYALVADIHTHGNYKPGYRNNEFSGLRKDKRLQTKQEVMNVRSNSDIGISNATGVEAYLVTPNGSLQKYDPSSGVVTIISNNMPSDVRDPQHLNSVDSNYENNCMTPADYLRIWRKIITNDYE